jgi:uncharacterized repeat protein (TIGR03803 family)
MMLAATLVSLALSSELARGQTYTVLYSFADSPDVSGVSSPLVRNSAGDLFGTGGGGVWKKGTLFKLSSSGKEAFVYSFKGGKSDGQDPEGSLARDAAGNFYGTTNLGGGSFSGTVFKLDRTGTVETILYSFHQNPGEYPVGGVTADSQGNLYGTTELGGGETCQCGAVFELSNSGTYTVLHRFSGGADGARPFSPLLRDSLGNLYGTTNLGGDESLCTDGCGTIFKVTPLGIEKVLYRFPGFPGAQYPIAGLTRDPAGNFYGATLYGGTANQGTVYEVDTSGNGRILYSFQGGVDGAQPYSNLIRDTAGNLYGTTSVGGDSSCNCGTIFKLDSSGIKTILHDFTGSPDDGSNPSTLTRGSDGNLYGSAGGGAHNAGIIYKVVP